jgi:CheY-like chemotaxis protein
MSPKPNKRRILFVVDDKDFLEMIERIMLLRSKNNWDVLTAKSASSAMALVQDQSPNLIVIDLCMPVVDGVQFLSVLQRRCPDLQKVVLTSCVTEAYRSACLENGAELFLEKPNSVEGMESIFATLDELARWKTEPGFRGVLRQVGLMDVIQMECLAKNSSILHVASRETSGDIFIHEGCIIHARTNSLTGEAAFRSLLGLTGGDFKLNPYTDPPEQTIFDKWEALLMDAAQHRDEQSTDAAPVQEHPGQLRAAEEKPESARPRSRPRNNVHELLIATSAGDLLHSWQCANTDYRVNFLDFLEQKSKTLELALQSGPYGMIEFLSETDRLAVQLRDEHKIFLRTGSNDASLSSGSHGKDPKTGSLSPARKEAGRRWFKEHLDLAGLLAGGIHFTDRSSLKHILSPTFADKTIETCAKVISEITNSLRLQDFAGRRARWTSDQIIVESARWREGAFLVLILSRRARDLDPSGIDRHLEDFLSVESQENSPNRADSI